MDAPRKTRLAIQVVEATIRELGGYFRKDHDLKCFYQKLRSGLPDAFVVLRNDDDGFVGLHISDEGAHLDAELWVNLNNREDGSLWTQALAQRFRTNELRFSYRSPQNPLVLARSMDLIRRKQ